MTIDQFLKVACEEPIRLQRLTNAELIHECLDNGHCDNPLVSELMRRVDPGWLDRYDDEGNPKPEAGLPPFTPASVDTGPRQQPPTR